ncbi:MAG TPA: DUF6308 family protein [Acidimicrobiales bacterium]|nr:DUF6308 family protein [Acidimicrobiales bacterium]
MPRETIAEGSPAARLWTLLEAVPGIGWVTGAKLLARKRPHLLPVYDQVVKAALQPRSGRFWEPLWEELQDVRIVGRLEEVRSGAGVDGAVSLLRILDVAIWMRNRGIGAGGNRSVGVARLPFRRAER